MGVDAFVLFVQLVHIIWQTHVGLTPRPKSLLDKKGATPRAVSLTWQTAYVVSNKAQALPVGDCGSSRSAVAVKTAAAALQCLSVSLPVPCLNTTCQCGDLIAASCAGEKALGDGHGTCISATLHLPLSQPFPSICQEVMVYPSLHTV